MPFYRENPLPELRTDNDVRQLLLRASAPCTKRIIDDQFPGGEGGGGGRGEC